LDYIYCLADWQIVACERILSKAQSSVGLLGFDKSGWQRHFVKVFSVVYLAILIKASRRCEIEQTNSMEKLAACA